MSGAPTRRARQLKTLRKPAGTSIENSHAVRRCSVDGCDRKHYGNGYCNGHYLQARAGKTPTGPVRPNRRNGATLERDDKGRKLCIACQLWLDEDNFSAHHGTKDHLQVRCRPCVYVARHFTQYGLKPEDIARIMREQSHRCAICMADISGRYVVDHDHACCPGVRSCGQCVRGFLCDGCNLGLGAFKDSPVAMRAAIRYVEAFQRCLTSPSSTS
jgi:hypothetical protein